MKTKILLFFTLVFVSASAQVTQIYTDFNNYWTSSSTSINATRPNLSHNLLAFTWNSTVYSTGVDNAKLTTNGVTFENTKFRALPINSVPLTGGTSYFIGFGALQDGNQTAVVNTFINPIVSTGTMKASYLTRGVQGLDLGTCLTNIPNTGGNIVFNLSTNGITLSNVNDGVPDLLISQIADPSSETDEFWFETLAGVQVGNKVNITLNNNTLYPVVANWNPDFYNNNSTQTQGTFVNATRTMRFSAIDLVSFGINESNYMNARRLVYKPGGQSDPAFLAFNEPSLGVARQLLITSQPTTSECDGSMPSSFTVRLADSFGDPVEQAGYEITAYMETGPGQLLGTLTATTNSSGIATFSTLNFEVGGDHVIRFENTSLDPAISDVISGPSCDSNIWTGNVNSNWNNTGNWNTAFIPNANSDVTIPAGRPNYPVLNVNAGANNLILGEDATVNLNGKLFTISGDITFDPSAKIIGSSDNSTLYFSGSDAQIIPSDLILDEILANLSIENPEGVTNEGQINITQVLLVREGNFETGDMIDLVCSFSPRRTAQVGRIGNTGSISGNITAEQCFPARRAFRFITSSVTTTTSIRQNWQEDAESYLDDPNPGYGTHITGNGSSGSDPDVTDGVNGFDWQPSGSSSLFSFNNGAQTWSAVGNTNGTLTAGTPYRLFVRGSRSVDIESNAAVPSDTKLRATGTVVKGPISVSGLSSTSGHFNLVGNPFQAVVDMNPVITNSSNLTNFYYVWDPTLGGVPVVGQTGGRGAYVTVNALTGAKSNAASAVTRYLQPYQAFFVETSSLGTNPQLTFREAHKFVNSAQTNVFRLSEDENIGNQFINLSLFNQVAFENNNTASDGLRIDFTFDGNNDVDRYDAVKFPNSDENISRKIEASLVSMEERSLAQDGDLLPLNITQYRREAYTMKISLGFFENLEVYLKDFYTNQDILLENDTTTNYNFSVNDNDLASKDPNRFAFAIQEVPLSINQPNLQSVFNLFPNPASGSSIFLNSKIAFENAEIEIYNVVGQKLKSLTSSFGSNNQVVISVSDLNTGVYVINVKTNTGEKFSSKFIKN